MKKNLLIFSLVFMVAMVSCEHKDLCLHHSEHAHRYYINLIADYRLEWEEQYDGLDWDKVWPEYYVPYESLLPSKPSGLRVLNYNEEGKYNTHNISADGGVVNLHKGLNDILIYNNDTEYIVFTRQDNSATTRATTRTRTRASYIGNKYAKIGEETVTPPDMLFANYIDDYHAEKVETPTDIHVTLHPLVFTYKIRYEFESGLQYVALARGALSGMARSVLMNSGNTSEESATLLYDCEMTDFGARAVINSFGVPDFPNPNYATRGDSQHALNLEVMLRNGKIIVFEFDVTDQVKAQPHGGVIVVDGIVVSEEDGTEGTGAFDVEVNGWGDYEDVEIPL